MFLVYVYDTDESATIFNDPIAKYDIAPKDLLADLVQKYAQYCIDGVTPYPGEDGDKKKQLIREAVDAAKTQEEIVDIIFDKCCVAFNKCAVVVDENGSKEDNLKKVGDALGDSMGGDSSTYAAVATWGRVLESHSIMTIDFPRGMWPDERAEEQQK